MMYDDGWPNLTPGRVVLLILSLIGLGWLLFQVNRADPARMSFWQGHSVFGAVGQAQSVDVEANALRGIMAPLTGQGQSGDMRPNGNPLGVSNVVMTQGYGTGTHAPAAVWGAIDLAIDGDGDGEADPEGSLGQPVYATHRGVVKLATDTWPAGNHVWVFNDYYKTGYAHLQQFAVAEGQMVERGQLVGYIGSTGQSSGPHLDYQVWQMQSGRWVNLNPFDFGVFDGT